MKSQQAESQKHASPTSDHRNSVRNVSHAEKQNPEAHSGSCNKTQSKHRELSHARSRVDRASLMTANQCHSGRRKDNTSLNSRRVRLKHRSCTHCNQNLAFPACTHPSESAKPRGLPPGLTITREGPRLTEASQLWSGEPWQRSQVVLGQTWALGQLPVL